jgi:hypothetical protein
LILDDTFWFYPQYDGDPPTGKDITASFKDPGFLAAVRDITGKLEEPILDYDVARIWDLNIGVWNTSYTISDLSGIEHFSALRYLDCYGQQLEELDLSKNTALTYLNCDGNQLTGLDVSNNLALYTLFCSINSLTTLDISNNINLGSLSCWYDQLCVLDVSKNTKLMDLGCGGNHLTALNVSDNTELKQLNCYNNQLTRLDVSKNIKLVGLDCAENQLTGLDVSDNTALELLRCRYNYMISPDDVIGWREIGLVLNEDHSYDTSFIFYDQKLIQITTQPAPNTTVTQGNATGTLSITARATMQDAELKYQWFSNTTAMNSNGTPIAGATSDIFNIPATLAGTYYYYCEVRVDYIGFVGSNVATVTVSLPSVNGLKVSGMIRSYNPRNAATIQLTQNGVVVCSTLTQTWEGYDQADQAFEFEGVEAGTYTLVITKPGHTSFTVQSITVGDGDVDLTKDSRPEVCLMTLLCGDIDNDGEINQADLNVLWQPSNYNKRVSEGADPLCDLNGDGEVNQLDLNILWQLVNYNKGEVVVS